MSEKESGGDFRYAVGESKVPWHAVGEFYDGSDAVEMVKFLLPATGDPAYAGQTAKVAEEIRKLAAVGGKAHPIFDLFLCSFLCCFLSMSTRSLAKPWLLNIS